MDVSVADAVQALNLAVTGLLPPPVSVALAPEVMVNPVKTHPAGIGGYIGLHADPVGEIHARRLQAQVVVRVKADTIGDLGVAEAAVTKALLGADQTKLRSQGIFRISRDTAFGPVYRGAEDGLTVAAGKDVRFDVDFEYRRLPSAPADLIGEVPLDLLLQETERAPRLLYGADFATDPLASFDALDDAPVNNGPGAWSYNPAAAHIQQSAAVRGGNNQFAPIKRGTYLVLRPSVVAEQPANWLLHAELGADSGGIGLVFNFRDTSNFYFFIMNQPQSYRLLGKKVAGNFSFLDSGGQQDGTGYGGGEHALRLVQQHGEIQLAIDKVPVLTAREDATPPPGRVGFLCRNCPTARFHSLRWVGL